jgi:hypothetical protein
MKMRDHASFGIRRVPRIFRYSGGGAIDIRQVLDATESPKRCSRLPLALRERRCCVTRREDLAVLASGCARQTPVTLGQLFARLPEGGRSADAHRKE